MIRDAVINVASGIDGAMTNVTYVANVTSVANGTGSTLTRTLAVQWLVAWAYAQLVQLKIEISIYCVGGTPTTKSAAAAVAR